MIDTKSLVVTAEMFNGIGVGDRIVYRHRSKLDNTTIKTRRVTKVNKKSVVVMENGKKTRIGWESILRA